MLVNCAPDLVCKTIRRRLLVTIIAIVFFIADVSFMMWGDDVRCSCAPLCSRDGLWKWAEDFFGVQQNRWCAVCLRKCVCLSVSLSVSVSLCVSVCACFCPHENACARARALSETDLVEMCSVALRRDIMYDAHSLFDPRKNDGERRLPSKCTGSRD